MQIGIHAIEFANSCGPDLDDIRDVLAMPIVLAAYDVQLHHLPAHAQHEGDFAAH